MSCSHVTCINVVVACGLVCVEQLWTFGSAGPGPIRVQGDAERLHLSATSCYDLISGGVVEAQCTHNDSQVRPLRYPDFVVAVTGEEEGCFLCVSWIASICAVCKAQVACTGFYHEDKGNMHSFKLGVPQS